MSFKCVVNLQRHQTVHISVRLQCTVASRHRASFQCRCVAEVRPTTTEKGCVRQCLATFSTSGTAVQSTGALQQHGVGQQTSTAASTQIVLRLQVVTSISEVDAGRCEMLLVYAVNLSF